MPSENSHASRSHTKSTKRARLSPSPDHDVLWDLGYPHAWDHPRIREQLLYNDVVPDDLWYEWRDLRVLDEVHWYG